MSSDASASGSTPSWRNRILLLAVALTVRVAYLTIKPTNVYSDDVRGWKTVAATFAAGHNPYTTGLLNWPPVWPCVIWGLDHLSHASGIGFVWLIWAVLISIELIVIQLAYGLSCHFAKPRIARNAVLIGLAVNPSAILQTTQHGNFDVLVAVLVLLSFRSLCRWVCDQQPRHWLGAAAWLGFAAGSKTVPLVLFPLLATGTRNLRWKHLVSGGLLVVGPLALGLSIIFALDPAAVRAYVLNYRSFGEFFGVSGIAYLLGWEWAPPILSRLFSFVLLLSLAGMSVALYRKTVAQSRMIFLLAAVLLLAIPTLGPGFSLQYIYWYLPLLVVSWTAWPDRNWRRLLVAGWVIGAATYCFEYAVQPPLGNLLIRWFPKSDWAYALSISWSDRRSQILDRLPLFAVSVAILLEAGRMLWRETQSAETEKPRRSEALSV